MMTATTIRQPRPLQLLLLLLLIVVLQLLDFSKTRQIEAFVVQSSSSSVSTSSSASTSSSVPSSVLSMTTTTNDDDDNDNSNGAEDNNRPVVAIVGSGAVGGYYGGRLWESGAYDVHFHMRAGGRHLRASRRRGLHVTSIGGDIRIPPAQLQTFTDPHDLSKRRVVDWVIVALKSSSLDEIPELIYPLLEPHQTKVLCIMNGLIEDDLIRALKVYAGEIQENENEDDNENEDVGRKTTTAAAGGGRGRPEDISCCKAVYGGMALICSNRIGPGRIDHSYAGLLSAGVAARSPEHDENVIQDDFERLFEPTSVPTSYEPSILAGRWRKCLWNVPFNGISVSMGGLTVDKIVTDPGLRQLAYDLMDETIEAANADLQHHGLDSTFYVGEEDKVKMMTLSDGMGEYRTSTMLDFVNGRPMETKFIFRKPMERAHALGVSVPKLETIVAMIEALDKLRTPPANSERTTEPRQDVTIAKKEEAVIN